MEWSLRNSVNTRESTSNTTLCLTPATLGGIAGDHIFAALLTCCTWDMWTKFYLDRRSLNGCLPLSKSGLKPQIKAPAKNRVEASCLEKRHFLQIFLSTSFCVQPI